MRQRSDYEVTPGLMRIGKDGGCRADGTPSAVRRSGKPGRGDASFCLNVRRADGGGLCATKGGGKLFDSDYPVVGVDKRDDDWNFFSLDEELNLWYECRLEGDSAPCKVGKLLAQLPAKPIDWAACGEFVVIRLADNRLYYLLWDCLERDYLPLGFLPQKGEISVELIDEFEFAGDVAPSKFSSVIADPRRGDVAAFASAAGKNVAAAFEEATRAARMSGYWTQPVAVRVAWRLWDGSLLHVSEPVIAAGWAPETGGRVSLALESNDKGYTGTAAGVLKLKGYHLQVNLPASVGAAWSSVVSAVEIWVSPEPEVLNGECSFGLHSSGSELAVNVVLGHLSAAEIADKCYRSPLERMLVLPSDAGSEESRVSRVEFYGDMLDASRVATQIPEKASAIAGHGDYLHLYDGKELTTSRRGNPFLKAGGSLSPGGKVRAIVAQPWGGGAYTRQYLYLFTDRGIVALTHDYDGAHRNLRIVSRAAVASSQMVAATDDAVYALGDEGELIRLRDARAETLLRGMTGFRLMVGCRRHGELWMFPEAGRYWLAINPELCEGSMRSYGFSTLPGDYGGRLFSLSASGVEIAEDERGPEDEIEWSGFPDSIATEGETMLCVEAYDDAALATLTVREHYPGAGPQQAASARLGAVRLSGGISGEACCAMMLPSGERRKLSVSAKGKLSELRRLRLVQSLWRQR